MTTEREVIRTDPKLDLGTVVSAPASPAIKANGFVFTTGYLSIDPETGRPDQGTIEHETRRTLKNLELVLQAAGSSLGKVVKTHIFLQNIDRDFDAMNGVYREFFTSDYPARRTVEAKLIQGYKVEIEVIALA
jgi:2-iminobutanoate/2-iminopropanoate deaminase